MSKNTDRGLVCIVNGNNESVLINPGNISSVEEPIGSSTSQSHPSVRVFMKRNEKRPINIRNITVEDFMSQLKDWDHLIIPGEGKRRPDYSKAEEGGTF